MLLEEKTPFKSGVVIPEFCIQLNEDEFLHTSDANQRFLTLLECKMMQETYVGQTNALSSPKASPEPIMADADENSLEVAKQVKQIILRLPVLLIPYTFLMVKMDVILL